MAYTNETFSNGDSTYGYRIKLDSNTVAEQSIVPCLSGLNGFSTDADAQTIADLFIDRLNASAWTSNPYLIGEHVTYDGLTYKAITNNTDKQPDISTDDWEETNVEITIADLAIIGL